MQTTTTTLKPCGTVAAARRHQRAKEPLCDACDAVWKAHQSAMYLNRKRRRVAEGAA